LADLFRKEAVTHATRRLTGDVVLAIPLSTKLISGMAVAVVLGGTAFAATASYARKETVPGWLAPQGGLIRIAARQGGLIDTLHVQEGAVVRAGQPLATLQLSADSGFGDVGAALQEALASEATAAEAQSQAGQAKLSAEVVQLSERAAALRRELGESRSRIAAGVARVRLVQTELDRAETLAERGFLPRRDLDVRRSAVLAAENEQSVLRSAALGLEREIGEVEARLRALPSDQAAIRAQSASARATMSQKRTQTEALNTYVATASISGRVAALPVDRGQTVAAGAAVAVLTPVNSVLEAELYVPSRAAGFIRKGQEVRLQYQAYPHQKFGTGRAVVTSVSRTVLAPSEVAIPGLEIREPVFRIRARLDRETVAAYGERLPLQPGMLVTADVVIDRRTLFEWLLDPLYAAGRRG
jgi:membrane fusion protein